MENVILFTFSNFSTVCFSCCIYIQVIWNNGTVVCITVFGGSNLYLSSKIWDIRQNPFYILSSLSHTHFNLMLLNVSSERNVYSLGINSISFFTIWQLYAWSLQLTHPRRLFFSQGLRKFSWYFGRQFVRNNGLELAFLLDNCIAMLSPYIECNLECYSE